MSHTFEPVVERLVIATCVPPYSTRDTGQFGLLLSSNMQSTPAPALLLMNISGKEVLPPEVADSYRTLMQRDNAWVARVALWVANHGHFAAQMATIASQAGNPKRRVCVSAQEVEDWLLELASPREKMEIQRYLKTRAPK